MITTLLTIYLTIAYCIAFFSYSLNGNVKTWDKVGYLLMPIVIPLIFLASLWDKLKVKFWL